MNHPLSEWLNFVIPAGDIAMLAALLIGLNRSLKRAAWSEPDRRRAFGIVAAFLIGWNVLAAISALLGAYLPGPSGTPTIQVAILIPLIVGLVLLFRWPLLKRVAAAVPQSWMAGIQFFRVEGAVFLVLYAAGRLPGAFALPAGIGDVLVGLLAPLAGIAFTRNWRGARGWLIAWNLLGIADLVTALTAGFLTSPSRFQLLALDQPNRLIVLYPLVMIPIFLVPLALLLHTASLRKVLGRAA